MKRGEPGAAGGEEFVELSQFEIDERSVRLLKYEYCLENEVVVLGAVDPRGKDPVTVGMLDPSRVSLVTELQNALGRLVRPVQLNAWEIRRALDEGYRIADRADGGALLLRPVRDFSFEREAQVPELLDEILGRAVQLRASDVHIETYERDVDVRFRVDGLLQQVATPLSRANIQAVITRLKVLAGLDIAERRRAQDGRIQAVYREGHEERGVDFRLSIVPGPFGEDAVLRLLDSTAPLLGLDRLGLGEEALATFERLITNPEGLVLVTGPTGSGKTTTLYAAIHRMNSPENKILTVEDPIEYHFAKTNQKQVSQQMGFADYARAFMRQNPDVILIGEIRDEDTASAALRAAQTGHLVLATLHTNDAVRTISRLHTLGVDLGLIAGSMLGAISQRLVRRLCPECRREAASTPGESHRLRLGASDVRFFGPGGCDACGGKGYKGRLGIYELFVLDGELADLVAEGAPIHRIRAAAVDKGMKSLLDDALEKARAGTTSLEEILRAVPYRILEGR
ncbi:MAG TPA: GspE/PulE family protein [Thermoanaerobaculia bacterium]|nr:GspE/PulE family protein [Thermoanaerobaculia bacterium]